MIIDRFAYNNKQIVVLSKDITKELYAKERTNNDCIIFFLGSKINLPQKQLLKKKHDISDDSFVFFVCFEKQRYHRATMIDFLNEEV